MFLLVLFLIVAIPILEIAVFVQVASMIGVLDTVGVLLLFSIGGLLLVRHEGMGTWARARDELDAGRMPTGHLADGAWLFVAGVLLLIPGFVTDIAGLLLLLPPVRWLAKRGVARRFGRTPGNSVIRVQATRDDGWQVDEWGPDGWHTTGTGAGGAGGDVIDAEAHEHREPPELLP
jgi:UPF0716 family protein affecting phage T7 exclusion